jgi:general secretion pathway protein C
LATQQPVPNDFHLQREKTQTIQMQAKESMDASKAVTVRNLSGATDKAMEGKTDTTQEMPMLSTLLVLNGTVAGEGKYSFAVLTEKSNDQQVLVKIGNQIAGATLITVIRDAVVLKYMGRDEILKCSHTPGVTLLPPGSEGSAGSSSGRVIISRNDVHASLTDMGQMLSQAKILPYLTAGVSDGYLISQIQPGSIYDRLGIIEEDILQSVNDRRIQTVDDVVELYNILKAGSNLSLIIKRRGNAETLNIQFP